MGINAVAQKEDAWDKVAKALTIANQGLGIVSDVQSIRASSQKMEDNRAAQDRIKNGVITPKEQLEYSKDYTQADTQGPGSFHLKTPEGKDVYYSPKSKDKSADSLALSQKDVAEFQNKGFGLVPPGTNGSTLYSAVGPDGKTQQIGLVPPKFQDPNAAAKEPKGDQFKVALYGKRMEQAEGVFNDLAKSGYDPTSAGSGVQRTTFLGIGLPDRLKGEDVKKQEQAERNFVNAVLRRESGAAISPSEFESAAKQYFPRGGDTADVLQQKSDNRALAIQGFKAEAGPAWGKYTAKPSTTALPRGKSPGGPSTLVDSAQAGGKSFSPEDVQALDWAKKNPKDPRAAEIMSHVKSKGL